ncbi:MAG: efflux transporter outer membrane subunit [Gammaproteobacteria bacterium]|nr:efflux transporter outer membrane subunit [Gammaproteobacteria bacterium]
MQLGLGACKIHSLLSAKRIGLISCGLVLSMALGLTGCASSRDRHDVPGVPLPQQYPAAKTLKHAPQSGPFSEEQLARWWTLLRSQKLDELVDLALSNNADLRIAAQRVVQASARTAQKNADRVPRVTAPFEFRAEAPSSIGSVEKGEKIPRRATYAASLRGDWRPDIWGEFLSAYRSSDFQLWSALFDYDWTRQQLIADLVNAYIEYLSLNDQMRTARETEGLISNVLVMLQQRLDKGDATALDLERQKAAVYSTQTLTPTIKLEQQRVKSRIARLTGTLTEQINLGNQGLRSLSFKAYQPKLPSSLLLYRADVRAIEALLLGADANIDVARAQMLPVFDITAQVGYGGLKLEELFQPHTLFWKFIASSTATIFDRGRRKQQVKLAESQYEELLEDYYRSLYDAVLEVETAIASIEHTSEKTRKQRQAAAAARQAWDYSMEIYGKSQIDYFSLLDNGRTLQRHLLDAIRYNQERHLGLVSLYRAIGAGTPPRLPLPGEGARPEAQRQATSLPDQHPEFWQGYSAKADGSKQEQDSDDGNWLLSLSGLHSRDSAEASWRTIGRKLGKGAEGRALLAQLEHTSHDQDGRQIHWYGLSIEGFNSQDEAQALCQELGKINLRCNPLQRQKPTEYAARMPWKPGKR